MAVNWTKEQEQVINLRNRNILVSAAAGSGKTAVLVQRILKKVMDPEHPVDIDRLLIMTFTRAAAGEMRERIANALATMQYAMEFRMRRKFCRTETSSTSMFLLFIRDIFLILPVCFASVR